MKQFTLFCLLSLIAVSCGRYSEKEKQEFDTKIKNYIAKNQLQMTKSDSRLYYRIDEIGEGEEIKPTAIILAKYSGKLLSGKIFDEQKEPVELTLNKLVHGWREIAYYLKPGGKATIICPPHLGYGPQAIGDIPKDAILIFDIEIVEAY